MDRFVCIKDKQEQKTKFNDDTELRIKYKPKFIQDLCYTDAFKNTSYFLYKNL